MGSPHECLQNRIITRKPLSNHHLPYQGSLVPASRSSYPYRSLEGLNKQDGGQDLVRDLAGNWDDSSSLENSTGNHWFFPEI